MRKKILVFVLFVFVIIISLFFLRIQKPSSLPLREGKIFGVAEIQSDKIVVVVNKDFTIVPFRIKDGNRTEIIYHTEPDTLTLKGGFMPTFYVVKTEKQTAFEKEPIRGVTEKLIITGLADGPRRCECTIERITTLSMYEGMADTIVMQSSYKLKGDNSLSFVELNGARYQFVSTKKEPLRLYYGPAAETLYKDEDYFNLPVVSGYRKSGDLLGGGTPVIDVWGREGGFALMLLEQGPSTMHLPISVDDQHVVHMGWKYEPIVAFKEQAELKPNELYTIQPVAFSVHEGDYYLPLRRLSRFLKLEKEYPQGAYEPYWKTWGLGSDWTKEQVLTMLDQLKNLGFRAMLFDYGWFEREGEWIPDSSKFFGEQDFIQLVQIIKKKGFRVGLWYAPLQVDPEISSLRRLVVKDKNNNPYEDDDDLWNLDPSEPAVQDKVRQDIARFRRWGVDHLYLDSQQVQLAIPPDYDATHVHKDDVLASFRALPSIYRLIRQEARGMLVEICPDGRSQTVFNMPFVDINNIGDPGSDRQVREEFKSLKALRGPVSPINNYIDPFEDNSVSGDFANNVGLGIPPSSIMRDTRDLGEQLWKKWLSLYKKEYLVQAEYQNQYILGFDIPEGHVMKHGVARYYSFFINYDPIRVCLKRTCMSSDELTIVEEPEQKYYGTIELRGLKNGKTYRVSNYEQQKTIGFFKADEFGTISIINQVIDRHLLLKAEEASE